MPCHYQTTRHRMRADSNFNITGIIKISLLTAHMTLVLLITAHLAALIWLEYLTKEEAENTRRFVINS
jgi:hypothetical protein